MMMGCFLWPLVAFAASLTSAADSNSTHAYHVKSGLGIWIDPETPDDRQSYVTSRGRTWSLVMSDEFNIPNRDFRPGKDHLWTSIEKPDGVNGAIEMYSHNMTSTTCDDNGTCYFYIKAIDDPQVISVYNLYLDTPGYQTVEFFYRSGMVQSWNKFCFQGGMLEVRAQLPGATTNESGNPDLVKGPNGRAAAGAYYPTWPGVWMMGNLGRAIFSASTYRMWPFSYNQCDPDVFDPKNQRISACDSDPGYGLNPNQGRGAPEIDLLEGAGTMISSSLQIGPGMPPDFRLFYVDDSKDDRNCIYMASCNTLGANQIGVPSEVYNKRGHLSWYQQLRYQANPFCVSDPAQKQSYETVAAAVKDITVNHCTKDTCSASKDGYADLGLVDGKGDVHWGINYNGSCFPVMNVYTGSYLCDPDNQFKMCSSPRPANKTATNAMKPFNYQMDAISSNWPVHVGVYTDYLVYQIEWVTGKNGYVRWMLNGYPIFEVTADTITNVPQDAKKSNPQKIMLEEPMYLIFNVALSSSWAGRPPNPFKNCRGDGSDAKANAICDSFPLYMKIDYIRLYQDQGTDLDEDNYMQIGCDPKTHPTREWINGHIDEYTDADNMMVDVAGGAFCTKDDDCTILPEGDLKAIRLVTGKCQNKRCVCTNRKAWGGPRCSVPLDASNGVPGKGKEMEGYGPPFEVAVGVAVLCVIITSITVWVTKQEENRQAALYRARMMEKLARPQSPSMSEMPQQRESVNPRGLHRESVHPRGPRRVDYRHNFV